MKEEAKRKIAVSVSEAAELCSVSRPTMYEILNRADCKASFKLGTRHLVYVDALKDWVSRQAEEAAAVR